MNLDEILDMWHNDRNIDQSDMVSEAIRLAKLHPKYLQLLMKTKVSLTKKREQMSKLYIEKWKYYVDGIGDKVMTDEERKYSPKGKVIKSEADKYIHGDPEYIKIKTAIELLETQEKGLEHIMKEINQTPYYLNNINGTIKFLSGG